jgi:hypothetical protein
MIVVTLGMQIVIIDATRRTAAQGGIETLGIVLYIATHEVTVPGAIIVSILLFAVITRCDTAIVTPKTIVLVTMTHGTTTIVIRETVAASHCVIALVLAVQHLINVVPMSWWAPILEKSLMTTFSPFQGRLFFLCTLRIQGSSSAFRLIPSRTMSTIALAFILTKKHTLVFRRLHPVQHFVIGWKFFGPLDAMNSIVLHPVGNPFSVFSKACC